MIPARNCHQFTLMLGIAPLVLAPVSEDFGRRPLLLVLTPLIVLLFLPQALAPNITSVALGRLFQGCVARLVCRFDEGLQLRFKESRMGASIEGPIVAGVLADVYKASDRGAAFGFYSLCAFLCGLPPPKLMPAGQCRFFRAWGWTVELQLDRGEHGMARRLLDSSAL